MALKHRTKALLGIILTVVAWQGLAINSAVLAQGKPPSLFTVGNILSKADAESAVEAKNVAQQKAQMRAFRTLLLRLTDFRAQSRLPEVTAQQAAQFITDMDVRNEGVGSTSYVATFGISFSENGVRQFLSQYGISPIEERGPEITIVPVYLEGGSARNTDRNPWRNALAQLDLSHAHVPGKLVPTRGDLTAAFVKAYIVSPTASLQNLKTQYRTAHVLMAVAELGASDDVLDLSIIGTDSTGEFTLKRKIKARDGVDESVMVTAAAVVFETVQERWKLTRFSAGVVTANTPADGAAQDPNGGGSASGGGSTVQITAEYSGLAEWKTIRMRLQGLPGVQNWDLREVTPRNATVSFDFPGGAERWREAASAQGLNVEDNGNGFVVRSR